MNEGEETSEMNSTKKQCESKEKINKHKGSKHLDPKNIKLNEKSVQVVKKELSKKLQPGKSKPLDDECNSVVRIKKQLKSIGSSDEVTCLAVTEKESDLNLLSETRKKKKSALAFEKDLIDKASLDELASSASNTKKQDNDILKDGKPVKVKKHKRKSDMVSPNDVDAKKLKKEEPVSESTHENTSEQSKKKKRTKNKVKKGETDGTSDRTQNEFSNNVENSPSKYENLTSANECIEKSTNNSENLFKVSDDWDEPLKEGETEIFVPNSKYKENLKLSSTSSDLPPLSKKKKKKKAAKENKKESDEIYGTPSITTPDKLPTPVFVKKSISKSGTDHVLKKHKHIKESVTHSEPKRNIGNDTKRPKKGNRYKIWS